MLERAKNFVINRAERICKTIDVLCRFENNRLVTYRAFKIKPDIYHAHIHTYPSDGSKGLAVNANKLLARIYARKAVGISDSDDRNASIAICTVTASVAYAIPRFERMNGTNACRKSHSGADVFVLYVRRGHKTDKYNACSDHIEMHFGISYRSRAVTAMADAYVYIARFKLGKQSREYFVLPSCKLLAVAVTVGKVGEYSLDGYIFKRCYAAYFIRAGRNICFAVAIDAETRHARIDLDMHSHSAALGKRLRIIKTVDGLYEIALDHFVYELCVCRSENEYVTAYAEGSKLLRLAQTSNGKIGTAKGYKVCLSQMWPTIVHYDFVKDCGPFLMPYYIFQGRLDRNTPASLVQDFYDVIEAPDKDLVWFENSAHGPMGEEPEKFKKLMREKFLKIAREANL